MGNKKLMLHYLIPLRLLLRGVVPSVELLQRYSMTQPFYLDAINALKCGDLATYRALLSRFERPLLKLGTLLVWERLILVAYRNLVRRLYYLNGSATRLSLALLQCPFKGMDIGTDEDEIACLVANLIAKGMIKGYISQEKATIVLSQKDPFPKLSSIQ